MLKRILAAAAAFTVGSLLIATPAKAELDCPKVGPCTVIVENPGGPGTGGGSGGGGGGGEQICRDPHDRVIDCYSPGKGWWDSVNSCYWRRLDPQPPATDPLWDGHTPADGAIYHQLCPYGGSWIGRDQDTFQSAPPPGYGGLPSPETLAARAINTLPITGPQIRTAPDAAGTGLVGMPTWLWTEVNVNTWGPQTASASVPGMTVTATARALRIEWQMGDGGSVTCTGPGTPYRAEYGASQSPSCSYAYAGPGRYTITGVTTWQVDWAGGGRSGTVTVTRQSSSNLTISELQVVTK